MNLRDFRKSVMRTWRKRFRVLNQQELALGNASFGIAGEAGELADHFKKYLFHDVPLDIVKVRKELGDIRYYVTALEALLDINPEDIMQENSDKLMNRYPEGFEPGGGIRETN